MKNTADHLFYHIHPYRGLASFNFRHDAVADLESYAAGYHRAAKVLAARMRRAVKSLHYDGFPVLFLYRHALELYLKAAVHLGSKLVMLRGDKEPNLEWLLNGHDLQRCVSELKRILTALGWLEGFRQRGAPGFAAFENLVAEVSKLDAGSFAFRYPVNTRGRRVFSRTRSVNVLNFAKMLNPFLDLLDTGLLAMNAEIDQRLDPELYGVA
jgi:hypothetical protein